VQNSSKYLEELDDPDDAQVIAVGLIDEAISMYASRSLIASSEIVDLLLDIRTGITHDDRTEETL
jgi:hypothetical protein